MSGKHCTINITLFYFIVVLKYARIDGLINFFVQVV